MKIIKLFTVGLCLLFLMSCKEDPQSVQKEGNFNVEFLFEKDGCKMYRFKDGTRYIYWSNCEGKVNYDHTTGGKNSHTVHGETLTTKE